MGGTLCLETSWSLIAAAEDACTCMSQVEAVVSLLLNSVESPNLQSPSRFKPKMSKLLNMNGSRKRIPWSFAEVTWLKKGVKLFGVGKWADIQSEFPFSSHRTPTDLKDKWRNLPQEEKNEVFHY